MRKGRRWTITAFPANGDPLSVAVAAEFNRMPNRYWTQWGATREKQYWDTLGMPVIFVVMNTGP